MWHHKDYGEVVEAESTWLLPDLMFRYEVDMNLSLSGLHKKHACEWGRQHPTSLS